MCTSKHIMPVLLCWVMWWTLVIAAPFSTEPPSGPQRDSVSCEADNHVLTNEEILYIGENNQSMIVLCYSPRQLQVPSTRYFYQGKPNRSLIGVRVDQVRSNGTVQLHWIGDDDNTRDAFKFEVRFAAGVPTTPVSNEGSSEDDFICHQHGRRVLHNEQINVTEPTYIQCSAPKNQFQTIERTASSAQLPVLQPKHNGITAHHLLIPLKCDCMDSIDTMMLTGIRIGNNNTFPPFNFHVKWDCCPDTTTTTISVTTTSSTQPSSTPQSATSTEVPSLSSIINRAKELGVKAGIPVGALVILVVIVLVSVIIGVVVAKKCSNGLNHNDEEKRLDRSTNSETK